MDMEDDIVPPTENIPESSSNGTNNYHLVSANNDNGSDEKAESLGGKHHCATKYLYLHICTYWLLCMYCCQI